MQTRTIQLALAGVLVFLVVIAAQPYIGWLFFAETSSRAVEPRGQLSDSERLTISIFERVSPSVVQIVSRSPETAPFGEAEGAPMQAGSGFVWDRAGHIVTNAHVVQGKPIVLVRFASGEVVPADIVGTAPNYDIGVIRVKGASRLPPPVAVGSSSELKVGQSAYAIGNPFGLDQSLTVGVISALKRRLPTSAGREIANVIQTDASINPGNSGGPLLDSAGRLIGVNTAIISPSGANVGIGFAIPVDTVNRVVPELIRRGRVPTPGIGIVAASEALTTRLGVEGVVVVSVMQGSPAERAGLRGVDPATGAIGDVIVGVNGKTVQRLSDLTDQLEQLGVGKTVELLVRRQGRTVTVKAEIADIGRES
jgi:2-alkenal reductase